MSEKVENIIIDGEVSASQGQTPRKATGSKGSSVKGTPKDSGYKIPKSTAESSDVSKLLPYQNSAMPKNNNQHERSQPDRLHEQNHNKSNRPASKKDKHTSDQNINHEEVKPIEEAEAIKEIEEADHIVE